MDNVEFDDKVIVTTVEVHETILRLGNKACELDNITAEHIQFASKKLCPLMAMRYTGLLVHGLLPDSMLSVELVPVIKDTVWKLNSSDNYRPIALDSIMSKVLNWRQCCCVLTTDNQWF